MQTIESTDISKTGKYLTFYMDQQLLAIPGDYVNEIIQPQNPVWIPLLPDQIPGVINLRGKILPLIDLNEMLGCHSKNRGKYSAVVVVERDDCLVGFIVDEIKNVSDLTESKIGTPPPLSSGFAEFACGMTELDGETAVILDLAKLLAKDREVETV